MRRRAVRTTAALGLGLAAALALAGGCEVNEDVPGHGRGPDGDDRDTDGDGEGAGGKSGKKGSAGGRAVAHVVIGGALPEVEEPFALLGGGGETLREAVARLDQAAADRDVGAVYLHVRPLGAGWGRVLELRAAVDRVRAAGRHTVAFLESGGDREYVVASGAEEVIMPPSGELMLVGLHVESIFLKELLGGFGVEADFEAIGKYKSAAETVTRSTPSPEAREAVEALVEDLWTSEVSLIAAGRGLTAEAVRAAIDAGPYVASDAVTAGLVTRTGYAEAALEAARAAVGDGARVRDDYGAKKRDVDLENPIAVLSALFEPPEEPRGDGPAVALLYLVGPIVHGGPEGDGGLFGAAGVRSGEVLETIEKIASDPGIRAVVVRVDSPGGSAVASDLVYEALRALGKKKPVIASMGDVAASGGYYVAMAAKRIVAEPTTITGSIGVVGGKMVVGGLYAKYGVGSWEVTRGAHAGLMSDTRPFSEGERVALRKMMEGTYSTFVGKAAASRGKPEAEIRAVAEGRVWSGAAAKSRGLVDDLGGLAEAIALARKEGGVPPEAEVVVFPRPKGLAALLGAEARSAPGIEALSPLPLPRAVARDLAAWRALMPLLASERVFALAPMLVFPE